MYRTSGKLLALLIVMIAGLLLSDTRQSAGSDNAAASALRDLGIRQNMLIGTAVRYEPLTTDARYADVLRREYNMITTENALKFGVLSRQRGRYDFAQADTVVAFAQANGMQVRGHTLVWHKNLPAWLENGAYTRDEAVAILREHIFTVVTRYRGVVYAWDVVNEALDMSTGELRDSFWLRTIGPEYIEMAFRWAHEADPNARLFYNDYGVESIVPRHSDYVYGLVSDLVARGVPVHGVGIQLHTQVDAPPNYEAIRQNIARLGTLGLDVQITEMDVRIGSATGSLEDRLAQQARIYAQMLALCLNASSCTAFTTWGFTDRYTWIPEYTGHPDSPLPFDADYQPKPAYYALSDTLAAYLPPPPPADGPAVVIESRYEDAGAHLRVDIRLRQVSDVYGVQAACAVDPAALFGAQGLPGGEFSSPQSFLVDLGFRASDGVWIVAASRLQPHPAVSGDALAFSLMYDVLTTVSHQADCTVTAVDRNGFPISLPVVGGSAAAAAALFARDALIGDVDNNGIVDLLDAVMVGANFNLSSPPAPSNTDLNSDGFVNVSDLVIVGTHFGLSTQE